MMYCKEDLSVFTCVRNPCGNGGGVSNVALQVHHRIGELVRKAVLISEGGWQIQSESQNVARGNAERWSTTYDPGVVHVHGLWTPFEIRAARFASVNCMPLVVSPHGMLDKWAMSHKRLKKLLAWMLYQKRILENASLIVVNSLQEYESVRRLGLKRPVAVIENGVEAELCEIAEGSYEGRGKTVLFLSRLSPVKGVVDLLKAWSTLEAGHGYQLQIYGNADPGYEEVIRRSMRQLGLAEDVKLCGPVFGEEKWNVYKSASFFVLPSYSENFGIVVAEAMLAGLPVITTRATPWGNIPQLGCGWVIDNNVDQLADALKTAIATSDAVKAEMGLRGSRYARAHFLWDEIVRRYVQTYRWVADVHAERPAWVIYE